MADNNYQIGPPVEVLDVVALDIVKTVYCHMVKDKENGIELSKDRVKVLLKAQARGNFAQFINWLQDNGPLGLSDSAKKRFIDELSA